MKPIRSKRLYEFLLTSGVLDKGDEAIREAKQEYRKRYKREWKGSRKGVRKELRPIFTLAEHQAILIKADEMGMYPTAFVRNCVRAQMNATVVLPERERLEQVAQLIGCAQNSYGDMVSCVPEAERILMEYLARYI